MYVLVIWVFCGFSRVSKNSKSSDMKIRKCNGWNLVCYSLRLVGRCFGIEIFLEEAMYAFVRRNKSW
jgi:hypothetical protein